jgi:hypothetical protein
MARPKKTDPLASLSAFVDELQADDVSQEEATLKVARDTLTGDIRDFILDTLRHEQDKRPWDQRSEAEQRGTIALVEAAVLNSVTQAVEIVAAGGRRTIKATLEQVTVKDAIKGVLTLSRHDERRHALMDCVGQAVLVVIADPADYEGERSPVEVKPDQGELVDTVVVPLHSDAPFH